LRIKDKKAVMPIPAGIIDYIEVNLNNDGQERLYMNGKLVDEYEVSLGCAGLLPEDMKFCDGR
jgi:hypothetical protein